MRKTQANTYNNTYPILEYNQKYYLFSPKSIILMIIGIPTIAILIFIILNLKINYWLYDITSRQIIFILNYFFNIKAELIINSAGIFYPIIFVPNHPFNGNYIITGACLGAHVFSIFIAIILSVPSSRDSSTNKDFKKRKFKTLFITVLVIHLLNIFRISFLIFFNFKGIPFDFVHQSLFFISAIIGALFFAYLLHKWLPELFISIYYVFPLMTQKKLKSIEKIQV